MEEKNKNEKPVTVNITNHNQFQKGAGAFITNLNHLTLVMDADGNMKIDMNKMPIMPHTSVSQETTEKEHSPQTISDKSIKEGIGQQQEEKDEDNEASLVGKLMPIFYNDEKDVKKFLEMIKGMESNDITDLVNKWVAEKRISDYGNSRKGLLWKLLHDAGLYTKTRQNWTNRVH